MNKRIVTYLAVFFLTAALFSCKSEKEKLAMKISNNEAKLFNDSTKMLDPKVAYETLADYQQYVKAFPEDSAAPQYLFKAADLAQGMRKSRDAAVLYKEFIAKYPQHPKYAASHFLMAFVYDNDLHQKDSARIFYTQFLEKFPDHQLAPSAKASLDQINLGLTDEELVKMFEARLDSAQAKN